jgi:hypothetical protein
MRPPRPAALALAACATWWATAGRALADDDLTGAAVFARGAALYRVDASGRGETEIAQLGARTAVRALRSDADGSVLLADLAGSWAWMPLDGTAHALIDLPCGDGPAQLAEDGTAVLCRAPAAPGRAILVELARTPARPVALDLPAATARLVGAGAERALVWADAGGVWTAPAADPKRKSRVAPDAPVRGFLASPDGERAIGVYSDQVYGDAHHAEPADVLMTVQLDGQGARRKAIRDGIAVEWSHDAQWVLIQDGASACIMRATGGQYKCWKGYTAASLSSDGRWALALGNRDGGKPPAKSTAKSAKVKAKAPPARPAVAPRTASRASEMPWDHIGEQGEPTNEPEAAAEEPPASDDVGVAPPGGPLALYRLRLDGAFTDRPTLLVKVVDGAAVWLPSP